MNKNENTNKDQTNDKLNNKPGKPPEPKFLIHYGLNNPNLILNKQYPNNKIITTKYNIITWAPKSLLMQFKRAANIYFLFVTIITFLSFSPINPVSMIATFVFVLACTMLKEGLEDYSRYLQDTACNNRLVWKKDEHDWIQVKCWTLLPGDIIKVEKDEEFSADTLLIRTTNESGYGYIETKSLDGETNLKEKAAFDSFKNISEAEYSTIQGQIECDRPNENLNQWNGTITINTQAIHYCKIQNLALKGCVLKNTEYVCGIVIYSGKNTKIMKNAKNARFKMSKVLQTMNILLYSVFVFEIILCITFGYLCLQWNDNNEETYTYIFIKKDTSSVFLKLITHILTYFVSYSQMIPISLYVVLEIIKIVQGYLIKYDNEIYDISIDKPATCRATDLIEELGQVEFIFSDKTGTLTQNSMVLKKVYINQKVYGNIKDEENPETMFTINGDTRIEKKLRSTDSGDNEEKKIIKEFFYLLSLCHAVFPEFNKEQKLIYQGASPDEISLVKGAQQIGIEFVSKEFNELTIVNHIEDTKCKYEKKVEMPFDSNRKRMSVIVLNKQTNQYELLSKGADSVMLNLIKFQELEKEEVSRVINVLSKEGLRVLVMSKKILDEETFMNWYNRANEMRIQNEEALPDLYDELEKDMLFLGCSAIEDKLQEGVSETLYTLLTCNIRIWVLTGDKQDTAEEIAKSCKLINENMYLTYLVQDKEKTEDKINNLQKEYGIDSKLDATAIDLDEIGRKIRKKQGKDLSIIVDGVTLEEILANQKLSLLFFHLAIAAKSVICCRVNPKQKSRVVQLVKTYGKWITLAIGDGANDVPMIMEAHIGIGIQGKEGTQAVRTADFSIGQFRFLEKLLLTYGRVGYIKISKFICYYFYKNIMLVFSDILYAFSNGFSGQLYFCDYLTTMYNAIFTSWLCLFVFSLERDVELYIVKKFPILYSAGQKSYHFNLKVFWTYIFYAILHGALCYYLPEYSMLNYNDTSGITFNHWYKSTVNFSLIIHVVAYKLLVISDFWNWVNLLAFIISILFYYICVFVLSTDPLAFALQNEIAGLMMNLICSLKFWLLMIYGPIVALMIDISLKQLYYSACPIPTDYIKQHLNDSVFKSIIFNDENSIKQYASNEAKYAEKKIKEILKRAREAKKKRRAEIFSNSNINGLSEDTGLPQYLDNTFNRGSDNASLISGTRKSEVEKSKMSSNMNDVMLNNSLMREEINSNCDSAAQGINEKKILLKKQTFSRDQNDNVNKNKEGVKEENDVTMITNTNNNSPRVKVSSNEGKVNEALIKDDLVKLNSNRAPIQETVSFNLKTNLNDDSKIINESRGMSKKEEDEAELMKNEHLSIDEEEEEKESSEEDQSLDSSSDEDSKARSIAKRKLKKDGIKLIKVFSKEQNYQNNIK